MPTLSRPTNPPTYPSYCPDDRDAAVILDNLALSYRAQGRYVEADPLFRRALAIRKQVLGPNHPDVATSLENYASLLWETGRGTRATSMEARAKAIRAESAEEYR